MSTMVSNKKVLIAAPIFKRAWILPEWLKCIENQNFPLENLGFVFELGPNDDETHDILWDWHCNHPEFIIFDAQININRPHYEHSADKRFWDYARYENMVLLRNSLLERATANQDKFDYYFSLDSDILLKDPNTISQLVEDCELNNEIGVVGTLSYMTPTGQNYPSAMFWDSKPGGLARRQLHKMQYGTLYEVDIVMASIMMTKPVFTNVRYYFHKLGEDLGFATELANQGFKSFIDTRIYTPHIMYEKALPEYLKNGDQRESIVFI